METPVSLAGDKAWILLKNLLTCSSFTSLYLAGLGSNSKTDKVCLDLLLGYVASLTVLGFLFLFLYSKIILDLCKVFLTLSHASEHGQGYKIKQLQHDYNDPKMKLGKDHKRHEEQHHCSQTKQQQHCAATLLSLIIKRELSLNSDHCLLCPSYREQSPNPRTFFHFSKVYPSCAPARLWCVQDDRQHFGWILAHSNAHAHSWRAKECFETEKTRQAVDGIHGMDIDPEFVFTSEFSWRTFSSKPFSMIDCRITGVIIPAPHTVSRSLYNIFSFTPAF